MAVGDGERGRDIERNGEREGRRERERSGAHGEWRMDTWVMEDKEWMVENGEWRRSLQCDFARVRTFDKESTRSTSTTDFSTWLQYQGVRQVCRQSVHASLSMCFSWDARVRTDASWSWRSSRTIVEFILWSFHSVPLQPEAWRGPVACNISRATSVRRWMKYGTETSSYTRGQTHKQRNALLNTEFSAGPKRGRKETYDM